MALIYAHFMISDCFIRPQSSPHADFILDNNYSREFLYYLLNLPVPEFLVPIIKNFTATSTPRRPNITFCPSAAAFNHDIHFGRIYPLNMYSNIHDIAASSNSRSDPSLVNHELLTNTLFSITDSTNPESTQIIDTGMLIASNIPTTKPNTFSYLNNKINQVFTTLFNPVIIRALQQKQSFAPINLSPLEFKSSNYNPYLMMFSLSTRNASELKSTLSSVASTFKGIIKCPGDLASLYTNLSGISLLSHSYSPFALPTFHYTHQNYNEAVKSKYTPLESEKFAKIINFLQRPDQESLAKDDSTRKVLSYPENDPPENKIKSFVPDLYSISDSDLPSQKKDFKPKPSSFIQYDEDFQLYPKIRYLNPYEETSTDAWLSSVSGLTIEAEEITGSLVPFVDTNSLLGAINSQFAQSAISFHHTVLATQFTVTNTRIIYSRQREEQRSDAQPAASMLVYLNRIFVTSVTKTFVHLGFSALNHGLIHAKSVTMPEAYRSFYGQLIHDNNNKKHSTEQHEPQNTEPHRHLIFSPYAYVSNSYDYDWTSSTKEENYKKIYFLTNLRTMFGTDATLIEISNPFDAMPIS
jgi:hypothetical protein